MRNSRYLPKLRHFRHRLVFTSAEAREVGIPARMLSHFAQRGVLDRVVRGVYRLSDTEPDIDPEWEELVTIASTIPNGTICLISALCYYNLADQVMRELWIAVPNKAKSPRRPNTRIIRMRNTTIGKTQVRIGKHSVRIFDPERTVIDSFRYLSKEIAIKSLKAYLRGGKDNQRPNIDKLLRYSRQLRVTLQPYLEALIT